MTEPTADTPSAHRGERLPGFGTLVGVARGHRGKFALLVWVLLVSAVCESAVVVLVAPLAQAAAQGTETINRDLGPFRAAASPRTLVIIAVVLLVWMTALRFVALAVQAKLVADRERAEVRRYAHALVNAPWEVVNAEPPGYVVNIGGFTRSAADMTLAAVTTWRSVLSVGCMLFTAAIVAPGAALVMAVVGLALFFAVRPAIRASRRANERAVGATLDVTQRWVELADIAAPTRIFGVQRAAANHVVDEADNSIAFRRSAVLASGVIQPLYQALALAVVLGAIWISLYRDVDVPALGAVALLLLRALSYMQSAQGSYQRMVDISPAVDLVDKTVARYTAATAVDGDVVLDRVESIEMRNVSYRFADGEHALRDVSLHVGAGTHVGIVGPSGAGKTTLAQLLLGLRRPSSGELLINGLAAERFTRASTADHVAMLGQSTALLSGSMATNIAMYRSLSPTELDAAVDAAGLGTLVNDMSDGVHTRLGSGVRDVSGGQRQRIGIARALAGAPSLVVLDEPTSALDADSETLVTDTLRALPDGSIVVVIAHRVTTLRHCDVIVVLEDGRVVAQGSHEDVAATNEFFRRALDAGEW